MQACTSFTWFGCVTIHFSDSCKFRFICLPLVCACGICSHISPLLTWSLLICFIYFIVSETSVLSVKFERLYHNLHEKERERERDNNNNDLSLAMEMWFVWHLKTLSRCQTIYLHTSTIKLLTKCFSSSGHLCVNILYFLGEL